MHAPFDRALTGAVALMRALPRSREDLGKARRQLAEFKETHRDVLVDFFVDQPPGSPHVDYDLLLGHPDGGTIAVSWRPDEGTPWSVLYADHWASNFVVTVNEHHVTVQQALLVLRLIGQHRQDLMHEFVDQQLIAEALENDPPSVSDEELQRAADDFRAANELFRADTMHRWLEEMGLSEEQFEDLLRATVCREKLVDRLVNERVAPFFEARRGDFDVLQVARVETRSEASATKLAALAREQGLLAATQLMAATAQGHELCGSLGTQYAEALPSSFHGARAGALIGPVSEGQRFWVAQVIGRHPAKLDAETRAAIRSQLFREWVAERRRRATVRWHWM